MSALLLARTLRGALVDRAGSLDQYLQRILADNTGADETFTRALNLFKRYSNDIVRQLDAEWDVAEDDDDRLRSARLLLQHLLEREKLIDQRFARAGQLHVPRSLISLVSLECQALGIDRDPVLTVGPPGNYETFVHDLRWFLYDDLDRVTRPPREGRDLAMIVLPYLEGTRSPWHPVVLGHEVAHYGVGAVVDALRSDTWITEQHAAQWQSGPEPARRIRKMQEIMRQWVREVLCDLRAARRYGPAAVASLGEFLEVIGATDAIRDSHPPGIARVHFMLRAVAPNPLKAGPYEALLSPWRAMTQQQMLPMPQPHRTVLTALLDHARDVVAARWPTDDVAASSDVDTNVAQRLRRSYPYKQRAHIAEWLADELEAGIPGREHCDLRGHQEVRDADVINAVWLARQSIARRQADPSAHRQAASSPDEPPPVPVERLADKAIDNLEFLRHWRNAGGKRFMLGDQAAQREPGSLSELEINRRLQDGSLVITPLLPHAVQEAGIDVRLSNRFIIFQRSAVRAFDALFSQDPRSIQSVGEKRWGDTFVLHPNETVLAATLEYLVMPGDLTAQVATRSSYGRLGLITATAVQVNPHFRGCLTLELVNLGGTPLVLTPGERIAQVILMSLSHDVPPRPPRKYEYPTGPQFSRVSKDPEAEVLRNMRRALGTAPDWYEVPDQQDGTT